MVRLYIVGCPRSGTTIVQTALCRTFGLFSVPETHFFPTWVRPRWGVPNLFSPMFREGPKLLNSGKFPIRLLALSPRARAHWIVRRLDHLAHMHSAPGWIEKTPRHLYYLDALEASHPEVQILHVVRNPIDTVSSLIRVTRDYPKVWGGARTAEENLQRWRKDISISELAQERPRHKVISHGDLLDDDRGTIAEIGRWLGCVPTYENYTRQQVVRPHEAWKSEAISGKIADRTRQPELSPDFTKELLDSLNTPLEVRLGNEWKKLATRPTNP